MYWREGARVDLALRGCAPLPPLYHSPPDPNHSSLLFSDRFEAAAALQSGRNPSRPYRRGDQKEGRRSIKHAAPRYVAARRLQARPRQRFVWSGLDFSIFLPRLLNPPSHCCCICVSGCEQTRISGLRRRPSSSPPTTATSAASRVRA